MSDTPVYGVFVRAPSGRGIWTPTTEPERLERELTAAQAEIAELRATIKENIATIKTLSEQVGAASELRAKCDGWIG